MAKGPKVGDLAVCSLGHVGVITSPNPLKLRYPDGGSGIVWTGIKVWPDPGTLWSSRNPRVIGNVTRLALLLADGESLSKWIK